MQIINNISAVRSKITALKKKNKSIGFVPTMGALHEGHLSLLRKAKKECDIVVLSIYVNPAQFGPREDFKAYPRDKKKDCLLAKKEKVDIIFYPSDKMMYPRRYLTYINVNEITSILCGKSRPTHFRGVTTIVGKLLNIAGPDVIYLGQKDAQQCIVIQKMIDDLNFPVKVRICPTVREKDGLALSSRNKYLSAKQRKEAVVLYQSLLLAKQHIRRGTKNIATIKNMMRKKIKKTSGKIDYIECVDAKTLEPIKTIKGKILIACAVKFGPARLIDNIIV